MKEIASDFHIIKMCHGFKSIKLSVLLSKSALFEKVYCINTTYKNTPKPHKQGFGQHKQGFGQKERTHRLNINRSIYVFHTLEEPNGLDVHAPQALTLKRLVGNKATASALANEPSNLP